MLNRLFSLGVFLGLTAGLIGCQGGGHGQVAGIRPGALSQPVKIPRSEIDRIEGQKKGERIVSPVEQMVARIDLRTAQLFPRQRGGIGRNGLLDDGDVSGSAGHFPTAGADAIKQIVAHCFFRRIGGKREGV